MNQLAELPAESSREHFKVNRYNVERIVISGPGERFSEAIDILRTDAYIIYDSLIMDRQMRITHPAIGTDYNAALKLDVYWFRITGERYPKES